MRILAATRSLGKQREIRRLLSAPNLQIVFPDDIWLHQALSGDPVEHGDTFEINARHKAEYFVRLSSLPTFADDSGLEVFSLGGAPGVRSKRWAGATGSEAEIDAANNAELVRRLAGAPASARLARYRCVLYYLPSFGDTPTICQGDCSGRILEEPRGTGGFGYDPHFFSDELGKTFGEASAEEKDSVSHRGRALRALARALEVTSDR